MSPDHRTPWPTGTEKQTLLEFLNYLRLAVVRKTEGIPEEMARRALVPSGTSLLGLVKHLTRVEVLWFQWTLLGINVDVPADELEERETGEEVIGRYRSAVARSNAVLEDVDDLSLRCARAAVAPEPMTVRWLLVHMVEETARHAGHADILREQLDGSVGR